MSMRMFKYGMLVLLVSSVCLLPAFASGNHEQGVSSGSGKIHLTATAWFSRKNRLELMSKTIKQFNAKYPNVTVKFTPGPSDTAQYAQELKLAFSSGVGQDIVYVDDINQQMLQNNNYIVDLTSAVKKYGWLNKETPGALEYQNQRTPGHYYTVPFVMAPVIVYYNKNILGKLGITPPKTLSQFEADMQKVKNAGYVPLEVNGVNEHNVMWIIYSMVFSMAPFKDVTNWYYDKGTSSAYSQAFTTALQKIQEWTNKGYFRKNVTAINNPVQLYGQGKSAFLVDGDWDLVNVENTKVPTGLFIFPQAKGNPNNPPVIVNATDGGWAVNKADSQAKRTAAEEFINTFTNPENARMWFEGGFTPSVKFSTANLSIPPLKKALQNAVSGTRIGYYLDNTVPGFLEVMTKQIQLVMLGTESAQQCWSDLNSSYIQLQKTNG